MGGRLDGNGPRMVSSPAYFEGKCNCSFIRMAQLSSPTKQNPCPLKSRVDGDLFPRTIVPSTRRIHPRARHVTVPREPVYPRLMFHHNRTERKNRGTRVRGLRGWMESCPAGAPASPDDKSVVSVTRRPGSRHWRWAPTHPSQRSRALPCLSRFHGRPSPVPHSAGAFCPTLRTSRSRRSGGLAGTIGLIIDGGPPRDKTDRGRGRAPS